MGEEGEEDAEAEDGGSRRRLEADGVLHAALRLQATTLSAQRKALMLARSAWLVKLRNDKVHAEPWVSCDTCGTWMHWVCAMFSPAKHMGVRDSKLRQSGEDAAKEGPSFVQPPAAEKAITCPWCLTQGRGAQPASTLAAAPAGGEGSKGEARQGRLVTLLNMRQRPATTSPLGGDATDANGGGGARADQGSPLQGSSRIGLRSQRGLLRRASLSSLLAPSTPLERLLEACAQRVAGPAPSQPQGSLPAPIPGVADPRIVRVPRALAPAAGNASDPRLPRARHLPETPTSRFLEARLLSDVRRMLAERPYLAARYGVDPSSPNEGGSAPPVAGAAAGGSPHNPLRLTVRVVSNRVHRTTVRSTLRQFVSTEAEAAALAAAVAEEEGGGQSSGTSGDEGGAAAALGSKGAGKSRAADDSAASDSGVEEELEFEFQGKVVFLFQELDGIDVLLYAFYLHEFGDDAPVSNRRTVYLAYLDSVHYLRPRCLRTPVYHSLLRAYVAHIHARGFETLHIWSCPPSRGDNYVFHVHPRDQRTPGVDRLKTWYAVLLADAMSDSDGVYSVTSLVDEYLRPASHQAGKQCGAIAPRQQDAPVMTRGKLMRAVSATTGVAAGGDGRAAAAAAAAGTASVPRPRPHRGQSQPLEGTLRPVAPPAQQHPTALPSGTVSLVPFASSVPAVTTVAPASTPATAAVGVDPPPTRRRTRSSTRGSLEAMAPTAAGSGPAAAPPLARSASSGQAVFGIGHSAAKGRKDVSGTGGGGGGVNRNKASKSRRAKQDAAAANVDPADILMWREAVPAAVDVCLRTLPFFEGDFWPQVVDELVNQDRRAAVGGSAQRSDAAGEAREGGASAAPASMPRPVPRTKSLAVVVPLAAGGDEEGTEDGGGGAGSEVSASTPGAPEDSETQSQESAESCALARAEPALRVLVYAAVRDASDQLACQAAQAAKAAEAAAAGDTASLEQLPFIKAMMAKQASSARSGGRSNEGGSSGRGLVIGSPDEHTSRTRQQQRKSAPSTSKRARNGRGDSGPSRSGAAKGQRKSASANRGSKRGTGGGKAGAKPARKSGGGNSGGSGGGDGAGGSGARKRVRGGASQPASPAKRGTGHGAGAGAGGVDAAGTPSAPTTPGSSQRYARSAATTPGGVGVPSGAGIVGAASHGGVAATVAPGVAGQGVLGHVALPSSSPCGLPAHAVASLSGLATPPVLPPSTLVALIQQQQQQQQFYLQQQQQLAGGAGTTGPAVSGIPGTLPGPGMATTMALTTPQGQTITVPVLPLPLLQQAGATLSLTSPQALAHIMVQAGRTTASAGMGFPSGMTAAVSTGLAPHVTALPASAPMTVTAAPGAFQSQPVAGSWTGVPVHTMAAWAASTSTAAASAAAPGAVTTSVPLSRPGMQVKRPASAPQPGLVPSSGPVPVTMAGATHPPQRMPTPPFASGAAAMHGMRSHGLVADARHLHPHPQLHHQQFQQQHGGAPLVAVVPSSGAGGAGTSYALAVMPRTAPGLASTATPASAAVQLVSIPTAGQNRAISALNVARGAESAQVLLQRLAGGNMATAATGVATGPTAASAATTFYSCAAAATVAAPAVSASQWSRAPATATWAAPSTARAPAHPAMAARQTLGGPSVTTAVPAAPSTVPPAIPVHGAGVSSQPVPAPAVSPPRAGASAAAAAQSSPAPSTSRAQPATPVGRTTGTASHAQLLPSQPSPGSSSGLPSPQAQPPVRGVVPSGAAQASASKRALPLEGAAAAPTPGSTILPSLPSPSGSPQQQQQSSADAGAGEATGPAAPPPPKRQRSAASAGGTKTAGAAAANAAPAATVKAEMDEEEEEEPVKQEPGTASAAGSEGGATDAAQPGGRRKRGRSRVTAEPGEGEEAPSESPRVKAEGGDRRRLRVNPPAPSSSSRPHPSPPPTPMPKLISVCKKVAGQTSFTPSNRSVAQRLAQRLVPEKDRHFVAMLRPACACCGMHGLGGEVLELEYPGSGRMARSGPSAHTHIHQVARGNGKLDVPTAAAVRLVLTGRANQGAKAASSGGGGDGGDGSGDLVRAAGGADSPTQRRDSTTAGEGAGGASPSPSEEAAEAGRPSGAPNFSRTHTLANASTSGRRGVPRGTTTPLQVFARSAQRAFVCGRCRVEEAEVVETLSAGAAQRTIRLPARPQFVGIGEWDCDPEVACEHVDTRHALLRLCQRFDYQFDSLRRAKYSSLQLLRHLMYRTTAAGQ